MSADHSATPSQLPRYDIAQSYAWNYEHAPAENFDLSAVVDTQSPEFAGDWNFCGLPAASPLGVAAGPLLNGRWVRYYARLGFDVLTYKTVRSRPRECYPLPNLVPVATGSLTGAETELPTSDDMQGSWAVSFGMPSASPEVWREDIRQTRAALREDQLLSVSVVGTIQPDWTLQELADDYAQCAEWAVASGADCVEINLSCPNVETCDGQLYQLPDQAAEVAATVRRSIGRTPLIAKIGHMTDKSTARQLMAVLAENVTALAMTNSVATRVRTSPGECLFDGQQRGICGSATLRASLEQVKLFAGVLTEAGSPMQLIGVGGARNAADVRAYLQAGAHAVHFATAAMTNPQLAWEIRTEMALQDTRE